MHQLIAFRALQGIGGGGLMSLVLAIIGDIVPPRQRGRYQGYFGAVFGVASVAGPLLGGFLAGTHSIFGVSGWRMIFYINLPLGVLALAAVATRLHLPAFKRQHKIDYVGAALLSISVVSIMLVSVWAGIQYSWGSPEIISLIAAFIVFTLGFTLWEKQAPEPLMPLRLFKNDILTVSVLMSILTGIAMFATILYIPLYQQVARGYSPTKSGLMMIPLVIGMMAASIASGRIITKWGHYKPFPIIGTILLGLGIWLFTHVSLSTSQTTLSIWMVITGLGLGSIMQVPTLAVQNAVERHELGTATSTTTFFRSIGSALGGAIFGTILITRLTYYLEKSLGATSAVKQAGQSLVSALETSSNVMLKLPAYIRHDVLSAYVKSFHDMFLIGLPFVGGALITALILRETPLRSSHDPIPATSVEDIKSHSPIEL
jgi:EmrB/QacA subfamily drug resistance transporter